MEASHFRPNDFLLISVDIGEEGRVPALDRVARLSAALQGLPGVEKVLSVATVADLRASKDAFSFENLYRSGTSETELDSLMHTL